MKSVFLLATVLAVASSAAAKVSLNCIFSDKIVEVGNLNVDDAVRQWFYSSATKNGVLSEKDYQQNTKRCSESLNPWDTTVHVKLEGQWGNEGEVGLDEMHKMLVEVMWACLQQAMVDSAYDVLTNCSDQGRFKHAHPPPPPPRYGFIEHEPTTYDPLEPHYHEDAVCGPKSPNGACHCSKYDQCMGKTIGHKIPSEVFVEVFDEGGQLQADRLTVTFTAVERGHDAWGGCHKWGAVAEVALSFLPVFGSYLEKSVKIFCRV